LVFFVHLANELVGSGGEGLEETTNTFGGFQTPFSISTKDFCGASVEGMCILSIVFLSFAMDCLKDFLHICFTISLPISCLFLCYLFLLFCH